MIPSTYLPGEPRWIDGESSEATQEALSALARAMGELMLWHLENAASRTIMETHEKG